VSPGAGGRRIGAPRIVALGGHEFRSRPGELAITRHLLELTAKAKPKVCLLPTAGGDPRDGITGFYSALERFECEPTHVSLFRLERERVDLRRHLLAQDLIYVAGGSMLNLIAIWRAHGLDRILPEAWRRGTLLAGQSAGAMCWFERGITASTGRPRPAGGLCLLPGSLSVHYGRDPERRQTLLREVGAGLRNGYALDDGAGLLFEETRAVEAFAGVRGARVVRVVRDGARVREMQIHPIPLRQELERVDPAIIERRVLRRMKAAAR
jgi:dipeptidase E